MNINATVLRTRTFHLLLPLLVGCFAFLQQEALAQRTVTIEPGFGTINDAIMGDTTATGARVDPNTVYVLRRGAGRYELNGMVRSTGYHLQVVAEEGTGTPPVLQLVVDETGASPGSVFLADGDLTLKGLYILLIDDLGTFKNTAAELNGDNRRLVVDDCVVEFSRFIVFRFNGEDGKIFLTNSFIRNTITTNNLGNGKLIDPRGNGMDTIYVENNTIQTLAAELVRESGSLMKYAHWQHNTFFNVHGFMRNDFRVHSSRLVEGRIVNNIFVNPGWPGDTLGLADPLHYHKAGIFVFDSLRVPGAEGEAAGPPEESRNIVISNNNIYTSPEIISYIQSHSTASPPLQRYPVFNPRAQTFVDSGLIRVNDILEVDPQFVNAPEVSKHISWATKYWYDPPAITGPDFWYDPDGPQNVNTWPLPEDFSYSTSSELYTAGTGGFPMGDLNWFPDRKAEWVALGGGEGIVVSNEYVPSLPDGFTLHGNYPNPFNPSTTIRFDLPFSAEVQLEVYDVLGRRVLVLPAELRAAGSNQTIQLDAASLPSGMYMYRVVAKASAGAYTATGRMILVK